MELDPERIKEMKDILEKDHGREFTWEEATEAANKMAEFAELLFDIWQEDCRKKDKLRENPNGYKLDGGGYTCFICGTVSPPEYYWYDKWGIKCSICQNAVNRNEIPASLAEDKESWYTKHDLESSFNVKGSSLRSWIKKGILKARTITYNGTGVHTQLFLIEDNKDTLPPKKMVESRGVNKVIDGKTWMSIEPWYKFVDPHEHLKGYKILDHLKFTIEEEKSNS